MKGIILVIGLLFIVGCDSLQSKAEKNTESLYSRINETIADGNGNRTENWRNIKQNIIDKKRILFLSSNNEFTIIVLRNNFNDTSTIDISSTYTDTGAILSSPVVDNIDATIKKLEKITNSTGK
jgi:hypothetical protein